MNKDKIFNDLFRASPCRILQNIVPEFLNQTIKKTHTSLKLSTKWIDKY